MGGNKSNLEDDLHAQILAVGLPIPERQFRIKPRRHMWDFAWAERRLVLDVQGGGWIRGRHHRPAGYRADCEKANLATLAGYAVLRVDDSMVKDGSALALLEQALREEKSA